MTPLQMAMVAATIGNGGVVPQPYVVQKIVAHGRHDGPEHEARTTLGRAIKPETAADADADDDRSSPRAAPATPRADLRHPGRRQDGHRGDAASTRLHGLVHRVRARRRTRRSRSPSSLEKQSNGFGGATAAPIAKQVMQALLAR